MLKRTIKSLTFSEIAETVKLFLETINNNDESPDREICSYEAIMLRVGYDIFINLISVLNEKERQDQKILGIFDYILDLDLEPNEICVESKFRYIKTGTNVKI